MSISPSFKEFQLSPPTKVWVLAPQLEHRDDNIDYYYDFTQSIAEYEKVFEQLGLAWQWQPVNLGDYEAIIEQIASEHASGQVTAIVLNLCDGDEINGTPGLSVVRLLEAKKLIYTGADEYFYEITTSKIPMKQAFDEAGVSTAPWRAIHNRDVDANELLTALGDPIIIKPSVSGGSMGVGIKNVVHDHESLQLLVNAMFEGYRGWTLTADGLIAESFITGPEYTVLISGSFDRPDEAKVYTPVERVFHDSIPDQEKFLSFDRLWEIYEEETPMPGNANFYQYAAPDPARVDAIMQISWDAYVAVKGTGYTRVDVRMDQVTGKLYVLEVNAQCGLSEDEDYTSIGAILRLSGCTFAALVAAILHDALQRRQAKDKLSPAEQDDDANLRAATRLLHH
jgi:D-alanine-D-alanine ligase